MLRNKTIENILPIFVLLAVFFPVLYSNYVFTDEAFQLWNSKSGVNYTGFFTQGRWLTGLLFDKVFSKISIISELRLFRTFSLLSWVFFLYLFMRFGRKWEKWLTLDPLLLPIFGILVACSLSVAVYIGWASCFEVGIASILGLCSGHLLFSSLNQNRGKAFIPKSRIILIVITGIGSLLLYQTAFSIFLLPFFIFLVKNKEQTRNQITKIGIGFYLAIDLLYYFSFKYSMLYAHVVASDRTEISKDLIGKLGFFFGVPLSQAFSFNFLYNLHGIVSQAFPILLMVWWLYSTLFRRKKGTSQKLVYVLYILLFLVLLYFPVLISRENFASYRTMLALNLSVSFLLLDTFLDLMAKVKMKTIISLGIIGCFGIIGYWNFNFNFLGPQKEEYRVVKDYINKIYTPAAKKIYFLPPPEDIFYTRFGIHTYRDEFGEPSTYKDWTPEPLLKQVILEKTGDHGTANQIMIKQLSDRNAFEGLKKGSNDSSLFIDMEALLR